MEKIMVVGLLTISLIALLLGIVLNRGIKNEEQKVEDLEDTLDNEVVFEFKEKEFDMVIKVSSEHEFMFFNKEQKQVGKLFFSGEKMIFEGDVDASAEQFFKVLLDKVINPYLDSSLHNYE